MSKQPIKRNRDGIAIIEVFNDNHEIVAHVLVDDSDYYRVIIYNWSMCGKYVHGLVDGKMVRIHRFIMNCYDFNIKIDHDDRNPLNCQKRNLIVEDDIRNGQNKTKAKNKTS